MQTSHVTNKEMEVPAAALFFCALALGFCFALMVPQDIRIDGFNIHLNHIWLLQGMVLVVVTGLFLSVFGSARDYFFSLFLASRLVGANSVPLATFPIPCLAGHFKPPTFPFAY